MLNKYIRYIAQLVEFTFDKRVVSSSSLLIPILKYLFEEVSEWLKEFVLKTNILIIVSRVQIPSSSSFFLIKKNKMVNYCSVFYLFIY